MQRQPKCLTKMPRVPPSEQGQPGTCLLMELCAVLVQVVGITQLHGLLHLPATSHCTHTATLPGLHKRGTAQPV